MNKQKFYKWLIGGLVLSNIVLITFLILGKPHHRPHQSPREVIIEKLHFDDAQIKSYDSLITQHQEVISGYQTLLLNAKNELYRELKKPEDGLTRDYLLQKISTIQREIELAHFMHFLDIKKLCRKEQQSDFLQLTDEFGKIFRPAGPPKKRN